MKVFRFLILIMSLTACSDNSDVKKPGTTEKTKTDYIFFLHNRFLEEFDTNEAHPEYGKVEYNEILQAFRKDGFVVLSQKRQKNMDPRVYSKKIVDQIDSLIRLGTEPDHITVIGTSKGGYIAQYVSTYLKNPAVNFVFIGSYQDSDLEEYPEINFCGNILNIYEKSDPLGVSAVKRKQTSKLKVTRFKEIELHTNLKHGFLYKSLRAWLNPCEKWAKRDYN